LHALTTATSELVSMAFRMDHSASLCHLEKQGAILRQNFFPCYKNRYNIKEMQHAVSNN
jgi:hypothetical protein